ncbi:transporter substrate-binding domain-containing protein [Terrarubrum flagellatum]|uniref:transporter substrate-binding domain-containing protein n=1 Tax=Terrirubrum flagellatum TaxID=2895980 RepID=UPI0031451C00
MRTSPTRRLIALAGACSFGLAALISAATSAQAEKLKLGNEGVFPPFSMVGSDGVLKGVEPDLAREMCKRMNVECEMVVMDFKALIPSLLQGKFDILISQLLPTPERRERLALSRRLFKNPSTFVVPVNSQYTFTKEGLRGKGIKLALQRGAATIKWIQDRFGDAVEYSYYDNPDQEKLDLLAGRVNMLFQLKINATIELIMKPEGKGWKLDGGEYEIGQDDIPEPMRGLSWAVKKGDDELLKRMNVALESIFADCTFTAIRKKYLDITTGPEDAACVAKGM